MGKWQQTKVENRMEGVPPTKAEGYIIFNETTFEHEPGQGNQKEKGKWGLVKLSKDRIEQVRQDGEPTPIMGIRLREPMPDAPDFCEYHLISVSEDELVLVPQGGEASFSTYFYKKVK
ncbi:MAG: hypothetical protein EAZ31_04890 [Cytophagia bacterium]|nr:MAG: hypothetical protein EAZ31_04890 [Cytophagia bacterium]